MNFPSGFEETTQPLAAQSLGDKGADSVKQLAERGYEVHTGLTKDYADQICAMAREKSIQTYCPNDCDKRFKDLESTERWLAKSRGTFLLIRRDENDRLNLAGYGWVGAQTNSRIDGGETTFALRIGEAGQGQGLATPFALAILAGSVLLYGARNIWLETWGSNGGAVHVYHKVGFVTVAEEPDQRVMPDGSFEDDTRVYMSLPKEVQDSLI